MRVRDHFTAIKHIKSCVNMVRVKVNVRVCAIITLLQVQQRLTISEVTVDSHELLSIDTAADHFPR